MSATAFERSPQVELRVAPGVAAAATARLTVRNSSTNPEDVWREALLAYRVFAMRQLSDTLLDATIVDETIIRKTLDIAWQAFLPQFQRITGPMIAESYIRGFRQVRDDRVPAQMIYALADEHAARVGLYFNDTSAEAMTQGFNTYVNRQVPKRAALERVISAYGLSPRQMSGFTSATALQPTKVESSQTLNLRGKIRDYISRSLSDRLGLFARQETHNLDMQAQQVAWLWMIQHGKLPVDTQKMWLTAKDEKVCKQCGPMDRKKVDVQDQFELPNGNRLYVPGAHVNCRCQVRLHSPVALESFISKADDWDPKEHPRARNGRFARKAEVADAPSESLERLLQGVQEARRSAQKENVIEAAPAETKPVFDIAPARPSFDIATPKPAFDVAPAPPKPKPAFDIAPAPAKPKPSFDVAPGKPSFDIAAPPSATFDVQRPVFGLDFEGLANDQERRQTAQQTHHMEPVIARPTRRITDEYGVPARGFMVTAANELTNHHAGIKLSDHDEFKLLTEQQRVSWIRESVEEQHARGVASKIEELFHSFRWYRDPETQDEFLIIEDTYEFDDDTEDTVLQAMIPREDVEEVVQRMLYNDQAYGPRNAELITSPDYDIAWEDKDGDLLSEDRITAAELGDLLGIEPDEYRPVVIKASEGYGNAYASENDTWHLPGEYTVVNHTHKLIETDDGPIPYLEVEIRPNVQEEIVFEERHLPHDRY